MARTSRAEKARTRERILDEASTAIRERGVAGVSIPALMQTIGLTHGTFYSHFSSKDALVAETYACRSDDVIDGLLAPAADAAAGQELTAVLDRYLSTEHRDDHANGCVFAAQTAEVGRGEAPGRAEFSDAIRRYCGRLAGVLSLRTRRQHRDAEFVLAAGMLGAVLLARAADDPALSERILRANRDFYAATLAGAD